ncbi:rhodanese-like domain-containing protein [Peptoniphilus sp. KCTC 25270]|uniref:rhodanese-like domain-containing protein n=1 Tax=Peptoniphilus sp. KCTC 25270 TaxID=2897414 RepID=UPI001E2938D1|nr:rhodanese-like domain-containing protein [Peptoniphilus sp. KCTC 25270]MCD1147522.1 rhodanese-like domain-containing protein [Peptoniphilus sp. KCTC 25270]
MFGFEIFKRIDINKGIEDYKNTKDAILLDVRTEKEFKEGRIPGSVNIPLDVLEKIEETFPKKDRPIFVYCHSGGRSGQAERELMARGYPRVRNIGGIQDYQGPVEL